MHIPVHLKSEYPWEPSWYWSGNYKLHYVVAGEGRAVVMLHGNPTWSFLYRNVIKELSSDFRCLALDHMGCGLSDKPQRYPYGLERHIKNAESWVKHLGLDSFDLILHDWGGAIGMGLARLMPQKIRKLIILNTAAFWMDRLPKRIAFCRLPLIGELVVRGLNGFALSALTMAVANPMNKIVKQGYIFPYDSWKNRIAVSRFIQDIPTVKKGGTFNLLREIETSLQQFKNRDILIGWGLRDFCFDEVFLKKWTEIYPSAQVGEFPDAGHYLLEDAGRELIPMIRAFLF